MSSTKGACRLYQWFLKLYPQTYREQYGEDMLATFTDLVEETAAEQGSLALWLVVISSLVDVVFQSLKERVTERAQSEEMAIARFTPSNPVRGFRTLFWVSAGILTVISVLPSSRWNTDWQGTLQMVITGIFILLLVPLLVRSHRSWWLALFIVVVYVLASFIVLSIETNTLAQWPLTWAHHLWGVDETNALFNRVVTSYENLLFIGTVYGVAYLAIREVEHPRLQQVWQWMSRTVAAPTRAAHHQLAKRYRFIMLSLLGLASLLYWYNVWPFLTTSPATLGATMNSLLAVTTVLWGSWSGQLFLVLALIGFCATALCSWGLTDHHVGKTTGAASVFLFFVVGLGVVGSSAMLPRFAQKSISAHQLTAYQKSCAVSNLNRLGGSLEMWWKLDSVPGTPDTTVSADLCDFYRNRRAGNFIYDGGYARSGNSFFLTGETIPVMATVFPHPTVLLLLYWLLAYVIPVGGSLGVVHSVSRRRKCVVP